ncbi:MAG: PKD domain-containing protein, partial [Bacteroidales bacterium]|nr:PKD domain-containing protein [Bacteroidales bacterium]
MKRLLITITAIVLSIQAFSQMVPDQFTETVTLTDYYGETYNINALLADGKYIVFDFFYTTCGYCQAEVPDVVNLYTQMGCNGADAIVIGLECSPHDAEHNIEWYMNEFGANYPIAPLEENPIINTLAENWEIEGTPTYVLIQPNRSMNEMDRPISSGQLTAVGAHESACPDNMPVADFIANRTRIPAGETITFTNRSQRSTAWSWTFTGGTPANSTEENPTITYNNVGTYTVTLTARNRQGNEDTKTRASYIEVVPPPTEAPTAYFAANQVTVIAGNTVNFTDLSRGEPWNWTWTFEGAQPTNSTDQHPHNILYNNIGTFNVKLIASNMLGSDT